MSPATPIFGPSEGDAEKVRRYTPKVAWLVTGAVAVAWLVGFGLRATWLSENAGAPNTEFEGHRLLSTADAYFHATGALAEATGFPEGNPRVPTSDESLLVALAGGAASVFGLAVEEVCLWSPAVLAPLIALPLILLGLMFVQTMWGFLAALLSVLGYSYWNRTIPGYFDTDALSIPYVYGLTALVIAAFWRKSTTFAAVAAALAVAAPWVHPGSERLLLMLALGALAYSSVFHRKAPHGYRIVWLLLVAFLPLPWWLCLLSIIGLELGLRRWRPPLFALVGLTLVTLLIVAWQGGLAYVIRDFLGFDPTGGSYSGPDMAKGIAFPMVGRTISELDAPGFAGLAERIAGHPVLFVTGLSGLLALCWRHRPMLLLGPLVAAGTVLGASSQRYTIFAVPAVALGNVWMMLLVGRIAARNLRLRPRVVELGAAALLTPVPFALAAAAATSYPATTALSTDEAVQLAHLRGSIRPGDFVVAWWDYAYSVWYYSGARTIIDGAKQNRDVWFAAEIIFTHSQREASSLARVAAEKQVHYDGIDSMMTGVLNTWHRESGRPVSEFVPALRDGTVSLPPATRAIYLYLPWRFVAIMPSVASLRPARGLVPDDELDFDPFLLLQTNTRNRPPVISGWFYDEHRHVLVSSAGQTLEVYKDTEVESSDGRIASRETIFHPEGRGCVVHLRHTDMLLFMSRDVYESVLNQLLFLVNPDPDFFRLVSFGRGGAVFRVLL